MKFFLYSDSHHNHENIKTYCQRPDNYDSLQIRRWNERVRSEDTVIHLGDFLIGKPRFIHEIRSQLNGKIILILGNHDKQSPSWYCDHGFEMACDAMIFRGAWLTHRPSDYLPRGCSINIHGHLHNIWHGFHRNAPLNSVENTTWARKRLKNPWQRLFACEYTNYYPIEFDSFVSHPDRFQARGPIERS